MKQNERGTIKMSEEKQYTVEFKITVDAVSKMEALELARDAVMLDYADVSINSNTPTTVRRWA